jgi:hypothetical protein
VKLKEWNNLAGPSPLPYRETESEKSHFPVITTHQNLFSHHFWFVSLHFLINSATDPPDQHLGSASSTSILMMLFILNPDSAAISQVNLISIEKFPRFAFAENLLSVKKLLDFLEAMPVHKSRLADACAPDPAGNRPLPTQPAIFVVTWPNVRPQVVGIFTFLVAGRFEAPPERDTESDEGEEPEVSAVNESDIGD